MKHTKLLLVVAIIVMQIAAFAFSPDQKVTVCHFPPGNPENMNEIEVSVNAVEAHKAHGDFVGTCDNLHIKYTLGTSSY